MNSSRWSLSLLTMTCLGGSLLACALPGLEPTGSSSGGSSSGAPSSGSSSGGSSSGGSSSGGSSSSGSSSSGASSGGSSSSGASSSGGSSSGGGGESVVSINAGGEAAGTFLADAGYAGGSAFSTTHAIDTSLLTGGAPPASVLQTERYGEFSYTIPGRAPGTSQTVTLYFEESYWSAAGQRTFDVALNGATVLTGFDIYAAAGGADRAVARTFHTTADASGQVVIRFVRSGPDNPKVSGLTVVGEASGGSGSSSSGGSGSSSSGGSGSSSSGGSGSSSSGGSSGAGACGTGVASSGDVTVDLTAERQRISGFGASTAWGSTMSDADADLLWSTTRGAGLSLHRIRIAPDGTTSETGIAKLAQARGATVWATPWSPSAEFKSNRNVVMGTLTDGPGWAARLAKFVTDMKKEGVSIYAVSAQNEPDANVDYESCVYTGASMASFIGGAMGPAVTATGARIVAPESQNWCGFLGLADPIMNDPKAASYVSIIATHEYGCADAAHLVPYAKGAAAGKEFWQTEIYDLEAAADPGMGSGLRVYRLIHDALTAANMNAWHYWWVYPAGNDNGALWDKGTNAPSKRLFVMGNFSRFVRPGYRRVATSGSAPGGVLLSAYRNPADGAVVVVAANTGDAPAALSLFVPGTPACSFTPWVTSASESLAQKAPVAVGNARVTYALPAKSVTTLVGSP
jgi:glucuronoarabinoxylan endo-1,4-beta-xylanase